MWETSLIGRPALGCLSRRSKPRLGNISPCGVPLPQSWCESYGCVEKLESEGTASQRGSAVLNTAKASFRTPKTLIQHFHPVHTFRGAFDMVVKSGTYSG